MRIGGVWIYVAQDRVQWWAMLLNLRVLLSRCLCMCACVSFHASICQYRIKCFIQKPASSTRMLPHRPIVSNFYCFLCKSKLVSIFSPILKVTWTLMFFRVVITDLSFCHNRFLAYSSKVINYNHRPLHIKWRIARKLRNPRTQVIKEEYLISTLYSGIWVSLFLYFSNNQQNAVLRSVKVECRGLKYRPKSKITVTFPLSGHPPGNKQVCEDTVMPSFAYSSYITQLWCSRPR